MPRYRLPLLLLAFAVVCGNTSQAADAPEADSRELTNLRAFARLYGVLRYFHPSDEAAALDWNRYAALGVARVRGARDPGELKAALESLVTPIAPTVKILAAGESATAVPLPPGDELVAWQHRGPGLDSPDGAYISKRTGRELAIGPRSTDWTSVTQTIDATTYRGRPFRLQARMRAGAGARVGAWAKVERAGGATGFEDDMGERMITSAAWSDAVVEGVIDADAKRLVVGGWVMGTGEAWLDDFALTIDGAAIAITDPGFESGIAGWDGELGNARDSYTLESVGAAHSGSKALHVSPNITAMTEDLYKEHATSGEVAEIDLGDGLTARVPLAVWSKDGHTLPTTDPMPITQALESVRASLDNADARIADLIVAWSVFDQFYPYFDVTGTDWQAVLDQTLLDGLDDTGAGEHELTLKRLVAALEDGHGNAIVRTGERAFLPLQLAWAEGQLVVLTSAVPALARGDVVVAIDGVPAAEALDAEMALTSGSPQWRRDKALRTLGARPKGESTVLRVARGDGALDITVLAGTRPEEEHSQPPIAQFDNGIWYFDLARTQPGDVPANIAAFAKAPGLVFDMRGYPNGTDAILQHLITKPEQDRWMHVAHIVRPALPGTPRPQPAWEDIGWDLVPAEPHIAGRVVFLTGGGAISYAESMMGYVETLGLAIAGGPTAGTNGNIKRVGLPTGSTVVFTGMKVTRHDGTRSHLIGILPTIPVEPTVAGIRAGRDEVLERALEVIRTDVGSGGN
jgi:hypothetical protein